jgi:hypothetical protein
VAKFRQLAAACLAVALTAGITGCGGSGSADPLAADDVTTIINQATANTLAAQSFTISGAPSAGYSVDLTIVRGVGCSGTIVEGTTKWKLVWIGQTVYAHSAQMPTNEWMRGATSQPNLQGLIGLCMPNSLLAPLSATVTNGATRSVTVYDGQQALALTLPRTNQGNSQPGSIIVTDTQTPMLLDISEPGIGKLTFTGYGVTKTIAPPVAS